MVNNTKFYIFYTFIVSATRFIAFKNGKKSTSRDAASLISSFSCSTLPRRPTADAILPLSILCSSRLIRSSQLLNTSISQLIP